FQDLLAVEIGDGNLGGGDEEEVVVGAKGVVFEFGQLAGANHAFAAHEVGWSDLDVPALQSCIKKEADQRSLQPRALPSQDHEARATQLGGAVGIEDAEAIADIPMWTRRKRKTLRLAPLAHGEGILRSRAVRHS